VADTLDQSHPDYTVLSTIAAEIRARMALKPDSLFAEKMVEAIDFVLDAVRTGRTRVAQLDRQEKAFVGTKVEHFVRDYLDAPKGLRRDMHLAGYEIDIKHTVGRGWMIPPESFRNDEPLMLLISNEDDRISSMGVMLARPAYLTLGGNRDRKRTVSASGKGSILWIVQDIPWPKSRWDGIDMERFRRLRNGVRYGKPRAALFFEENLDRIVDRTVVTALLHEQKDPLKRLRANGGARDTLAAKGIALLSGYRDTDLASEFGHELTADDFVAVKPATPSQEHRLRRARKIR